MLVSANLTMLWQREFPKNANSEMTAAHIEELSRLWARTGIVSKEIALDEIMNIGKHLDLSKAALNKQLDLFRMDYLLSSTEWTVADRKELLQFVSKGLNEDRYLVIEKNKPIFNKLIKEIPYQDRLEFITTLDLTKLTPEQQKTLFFSTITTPDVDSVKQLIEMNPSFKAEAKKAFAIATDIEVKRLLLSLDLVTMLNTEAKSDQRLFSINPPDKTAIIALNEACEKALKSRTK